MSLNRIIRNYNKMLDDLDAFIQKCSNHAANLDDQIEGLEKELADVLSESKTALQIKQNIETFIGA